MIDTASEVSATDQRVSHLLGLVKRCHGLFQQSPLNEHGDWLQSPLALDLAAALRDHSYAVAGFPTAPEIVWARPLRPRIGNSPDRPHARLYGVVRIGGVPFNVNAEQVHEVQGDQQPVHQPPGETFASEIWDITGGPARTVSIDGRDYLLVITPFSQ